MADLPWVPSSEEDKQMSTTLTSEFSVMNEWNIHCMEFPQPSLFDHTHAEFL